jgi:predicted transcriptional regulator with HTH domain
MILRKIQPKNIKVNLTGFKKRYNIEDSWTVLKTTIEQKLWCVEEKNSFIEKKIKKN